MRSRPGANSCPPWSSGAEPGPRPCPQPDRSPRRGRPTRSFGLSGLTGAGRVWPSVARSCSSAQSAPHRRTRSLGACRRPRLSRLPPDGRGSLFKSGHRRLVLRVMARTGRELAIVHGPQFARQRLLGDRDAELLPDPLDEVDQTPAHHAVEGRNGPLLDDGLQGRAMGVGELGGLSRRLAVDQALGPMGVELHHPVAHDLHRDPADPGRRGAGCSIVDRGQGQETPRLRAVLRRAGDRAQRSGIKVCPERNRHGEPPSFATLNQTCLKPTRPNRVTPSGTWYYALLLPSRGHAGCVSSLLDLAADASPITPRPAPPSFTTGAAARSASTRWSAS